MNAKQPERGAGAELPKPYYDANGITIFHADAQDIVRHLAPGFVLLTDPPYGIKGGSGTDARRWEKGKYEGADWIDDEDYIRTVVVPVVESALALSVRAAVTPGIRCMHIYPRPADVGCFWTPASATHGPWGFTTMQPILYYGKDYRAGKGAWPSGKSLTEASEKNGHPCPKPIGAWTWLMQKVAQDSEVIVDPFVGSGTTLRAAKDLGRRAIGIEREERFCEIAAKRMAQEVLWGLGVESDLCGSAENGTNTMIKQCRPDMK